MKQLTLRFVGIKKAKSTTIGPVRLSSERFRARWLQRVQRLGERLA